ncbi:MAG TPA: ribonuclease P protein component [Acidocella sp.]|nr:ribonuclease P protein component [Acidocella sp.]HQU04476.1 ribonuclease P protein component [Acidocella sp.]
MVSFAPPVTFSQRADFLRMAARGRKLARPGFVLQAAKAIPGVPVRVGYTATKKIGNAVVRNRARRRLKEAARLALGEMQISGMEFVFICRQDTGLLPFATLCENLKTALAEAAK